MAPRKSHIHDFRPHKRIKRILIKKCKCGATTTNLIENFDEDKARAVDELIEALNSSL